ncbi:MAG: ATPase, T2SS/T4P/T4SS family, partial [Atribacterota bacterium]
EFDTDTYELLLSRIKLLSGMKLNIKNTSQDGRFSVKILNNDIEIRSSILPGAYNESVVMRLLNPKSIAVPIEELGIENRTLAVLMEQIRRPNGMLLITGPTGSGKTTTLYAFMKKISTPDVKIITIEDPIEYHLPGIVQTQVDEEKEYTFLSGLRSALRQDPDVIMVGEIRDEHDQDTPPFRQIGDNEYLVDASTPIVELNELLRLHIPESEEFESLGGLVMELLGKIPESGESVDIAGYTIKVERMKGKRIITLRLINNQKKEGKTHAETDSGT